MIRFGWTRQASLFQTLARSCATQQGPVGSTTNAVHDHPPDTMKLSKVLGMMGVASRRNAEKLIKEGQVRVENQVIKNVATRIFPYGTQITVNNRNVGRNIHF